ncbi:hypothetical protein EDB19DRAFT_108798 [Suillus lakei]|nr:hypothetical protein EDB19DRAFT_108798 [Suillus lakei]
MYSKFISVAFVLAATLAPTGAVVFPRDINKPTPSYTSLCATTTWNGSQSKVYSAPCTPQTSHVHKARDGSATPTPIITPTVTPSTTPTTKPSPTTTPTPTSTLTPTTTPTPTGTLTHTGTPTITPSITPSIIHESGKPTQTGKPDEQPSKAAASVPCNGVQPWQVNLAYSAGAQVIFNNQLWTAKQWSYNNNPESAAAEWTLNGVCNQPISNKVDCTGIPAWSQPIAYSGGSKVTFNGHLWISTQWTQSNKPGDTSGTWKDLGACN